MDRYAVEGPIPENLKSKLDVSRQINENYLKTILILRERCGCAFARDVAEELGVKPATVPSAVPKLIKSGYITTATRVSGRYARQTMELTPKGEQLAEMVLDRHQKIKEWLLRLGIPEEEADVEACHMEHGLTDTTMAILQKHVDRADRMKNKGMPVGEADVREPLDGAGKMDQRQEREYRKLKELVQEAGGTEGVKRKAVLSARAGGDAKLETLVEIMEQVDDVAAMKAAAEGYDRLRDAASHWGGIKRTFDALEKLESLGGRETLNLLAEISEAYGDIQTIMRALKRTLPIWAFIDGNDG